LGLALAPARDGGLGRRRREEPEAAPQDRQRDHEPKRHEYRPQPAAWGFLTHRSCSSTRSRQRRPAMSKPRNAAFPRLGFQVFSSGTTLSICCCSTSLAVVVELTNEPARRPCRRRPLGVRLWLADVAAGLRLPRAGRGQADRRPPRALRLLVRASRHAGA